MTTFAAMLIERMAPWNTGPVRAGSTDLERWLRAIAAIAEPIDELTREVGSDGEAGYTPAWGKIMAVEQCPAKALPWLATFVGVTIPTGATEAEARELIKNHAGFSRGTSEALKKAIEHAIGTSTFRIQERTGPLGEENAYWFVVLVGAGKSSQALYNAINEVKPAGTWYTIVETTDAWLAGTKKWTEGAAGKKWTEGAEGAY
jgi:hypothetical protein